MKIISVEDVRVTPEISISLENNEATIFCTENLKDTWDEYAIRYNKLSEELEKAQINSLILRDIIDLRLQIERHNN